MPQIKRANQSRLLRLLGQKNCPQRSVFWYKHCCLSFKVLFPSKEKYHYLWHGWDLIQKASFKQVELKQWAILLFNMLFSFQLHRSSSRLVLIIIFVFYSTIRSDQSQRNSSFAFVNNFILSLFVVSTALCSRKEILERNIWRMKQKKKNNTE